MPQVKLQARSTVPGDLLSLFSTIHSDVPQEYIKVLNAYWEEMILTANSEQAKLTVVTKNAFQEWIQKSMPAKLNALHSELIEHTYPGQFLNIYPVPHWMFVLSSIPFLTLDSTP